MRIKSLLVTIALCGAAGVAMAQGQAAVDSTEMGVHPFKETANLTWNTTGFSMIFHGGINVFRGDYPGERFSSLGYPTVGIAAEYNFNPTWGIGLGYNFAMPQVRTKKDEIGFREIVNEDPLTYASYTVPAGGYVHKAMMHNVQAYLTFDIFNCWYPRNESSLFSLNLMAGVGASFYKNSVSFHDTGEINEETGKERDGGKYVKDGDNAHAHSKFENVMYIPLGVSAEFNVSRDVALGARMQYNAFLNDYVDNRYQSKANKRNDGMYDIEVVLRWKIAAKNKNHVKNVVSQDVLDAKYYRSHPDLDPSLKHNIDTLFLYNNDTLILIHRDTVYSMNRQVIETSSTTSSLDSKEGGMGKLNTTRDLELKPGWETEAAAVVVEGQSLSQLARKYYKNTFCWVYLWIANRSIAPNPNLIMPKCVLKVPKLNAVQKTITKQEAKDMCARYRGE